MIGYGTLANTMNALESAVSNGKYLLGDDFSAADVYVGSAIGFGMMFGTMEKRPVFEQYWQRLSARPAYSRAKELDDTLVALQKAAAK
jgi:glutathione S-transferase